MEVMMKILPLARYELPKVPQSYVMSEETTGDILACNDRDDLEKLLHKYKEKSLNARMKCDPKFATSRIFFNDKDYEFSVDPELLLWLNQILSMVMKLKLLWHILQS